MEKYLLGVDGGNSKTDYLLCKLDGTFVDILRRPTCSHEHTGVGYDGMEAKMQSQLNDLFTKHSITVENIAAAGFGLAGADSQDQIRNLKLRVEKLGFKNYGLANDGILGVKAMATAGVCSINGSGTVALGIDDTGKVQQVGGIGQISGDYAGGGVISTKAVEMAYAHYFRVGEPSSAFPEVLGVFGLTSPDQLFDLIVDPGPIWQKATAVIKIVDAHAAAGDKVCQKILDDVGINCGESVSGCIRQLQFTQDIAIVKAGSIWTKLQYKGMGEVFEKTIRTHVKQPIKAMLLNAPPALGAVVWAKELATGNIEQSYREEMQKFLTVDKYEELVQE